MRVTGVEGLDVSLRVNNHDLQEYEDDSIEPLIPSKASTYVEATSGAEFVIRFHSEFPILKSPAIADLIACQVYLDGKNVIGKIVDINTTPRDSKVSFEGVTENRQGRYYLRKFQFAELATNDGPVKGFNKNDISKLGEVRVECIWMRKGSEPRLLDEKIDFKPAGGASVPEKCLKGRAISHQAVLGAGTSCGVQTCIEPYYPYGRQPFATFTFKYRSRRDLQIEGIIPRSPSPTPPTPLEERDPEDLTPEEAREVIRRMKARQSAIKNEVKKEKRTHSQVIDDDDEDDDVTVSSENHGRKRHRAFRDSGVEIIDLSED